MVAPAALVAAGWTIVESDDHAETVGTVAGLDDQVSGAGTRWRSSHQPGRAYYPKELGPELFIGEGNRRKGTLIRFLAERCTWNHESIVAFDGTFSCSSAPLLVYPDGDHPAVPGNRWVDVTLSTRGDDLREGLLECELAVLGHVVGSAGEPCLVVRARGRYGPNRRCRATFGFTVTVSTYGDVRLGHIETEAPGVVIAEAEDQIVVRADFSVRQHSSASYAMSAG